MFSSENDHLKNASEVSRNAEIRRFILFHDEHFLIYKTILNSLSVNNGLQTAGI